MNVLVCGVGAIGSNLVKTLVPDLKGEHKITVLDRDNVEERNIIAGTQFYTPDQVGLPKVEALQFNIYKWYQREIDIIKSDLEYTLIGSFARQDIIIDCFDNYRARELVQNQFKEFSEVLHVGFSDNFTFAIEWAENYKVPSDILSGLDICELQGASSFVSTVSSMGSLVAEEFIFNKKKMDIVGGKFTHSAIK